MPCTDIQERCELILDLEDRVVGFSLQKETCGAPVGDSSILPFVAGRAVTELPALDLPTLVGGKHVKFIEEFMLHKQLVALRRAAAVYLGESEGGPTASFALERIDCDGEVTSISGYSQVEIAPSEVTPCGSCGCER